MSQAWQTTRENVIREYFQQLFLARLYQEKGSAKLLFKSGTALRIIWQSPRFSEDLDFTGGYISIKGIEALPASAVPGWPAEVPLPVEPEWKRDYAASVQRLIRDGVDAPLGNLFVYATRAFQRDAEGADRARSATEAFLYRRLETLPPTQGKFRLNADLPIPFDGQGRMEVDLLFAEKRIAIELDGPQHLSNPEAYRRDRRKDALLQENGFFVLRFLAEDIGRHLGAVLDAILRTLAYQTESINRQR